MFAKLDEWRQWLMGKFEYTVLIDRTDGDAWLMVRSMDPGEGITAHAKLYKWCMGTSGVGLSEKDQQIMAPIWPKT